MRNARSLRAAAQPALAQPGTAKLRSARSLAIVVFLLLALCSKSLFAQTHLHLPPAPAQSKHFQAAAMIALPGSSTDDPANCPTCREIAGSEYYLSPTPISLEPPIAPLALAMLVILALLGRHQRSHVWHSRGPPPLCQL